MPDKLIAILLDDTRRSLSICEIGPDWCFFRIEGEFFERTGELPHWVGFYDWLRNQKNQVVGLTIRCDEREHSDWFRREFGDRASVVDGNVRILISDLDALSECMGYEEFGGNAAFRGEKGTLAVSFFHPSIQFPLDVVNREAVPLTSKEG